MRLSGPVRAEHRDPLAVEDLQVERPHQPGELQARAGDGRRPVRPPPAASGCPAARAPPAGPGVLELAQSGLGGGAAGGHGVAVAPYCRMSSDELLEPGGFSSHGGAVPRTARSGAPAPRVAADPPPCTHSRPAGRRLEADDTAAAWASSSRSARRRERSCGLPQLALEPPLAGDVQVVVRLVEQQHLVGTAQQRPEHQPLLLAAGQRATPAPPGLSTARRRGHRALSQTVSAAYPPASAQSASACAYASWAASSSRSMMASSAASTARAASRTRPGHRHQQVPDRPLVPDRPDELRHHAKSAAGPDRSPSASAPPRDFSSGLSPAPSGPTSASTSPCPTRKLASDEEHPPVRQVIVNVRHLKMPDARHDVRRPGPRANQLRFRPVPDGSRSGERDHGAGIGMALAAPLSRCSTPRSSGACRPPSGRSPRRSRRSREGAAGGDGLRPGLGSAASWSRRTVGSAPGAMARGGGPVTGRAGRAMRDVVSSCVYGVDVSGEAVERAKIHLRTAADVPGTTPPFLYVMSGRATP